MKRKSLLVITMTLILATFVNMFAGMTVFADTDTTEFTEIGTPEQLIAVTNDLAGNYKLTADIDLSDENGNKTEWTPFGTFSGTFDGDGHTVSGFKVTSVSQSAYVGFFSLISSGGTVKNLTIANADFEMTCESTEDRTNYKIGIIAGALSGGIITGCNTQNSVTMSWLDYSPKGNLMMGGIVGHMGDKTDTVSYCVNNADVSTVIPTNGCLQYTGGISGYIDKGTVTYCINNGDVSATGDGMGWGPYKFVCGGISGRTYEKSNGWLNRSITYCLNFGNVTHADQTAGGILGASYYENDAKGFNLKNNFNFGNVNGATNTGLLTGCHGESKVTNHQVENNFSIAVENVAACNVDSHTVTTDTEANLKQNETYLSIIAAVKENNPTFKDMNTEYVGYQTSALSGGKFDVRFIGTFSEYFNDDYTKCDNVGFKISLSYTDTDGTPHNLSPEGGVVTRTTMYSSILATDGQGNEGTTTHTAKSLGGDYIFVMVCKGLPAEVEEGTDITVTIQTFYTPIGSEEPVYGKEMTITVTAPADTLA